ncbi:MAG: NUDIX hydrolase, partial [Syntrophomonadaceae bacterium]|nr:NUDIX hydrolase [Syntrophomonadaceae bacterium]
MEKLWEETIDSKRIFTGKMVSLRVDRVKLPSGQTATREVVEHPGAVALIAVNQQGEMVLVKQYRQPVGKVLLEIPAGKLQPGEDPVECARRELLEETGYAAGGLELLTAYYTTPGFSDEKMYLFLATELAEGKAALDEDEFLEVVHLPPAQARLL